MGLLFQEQENVFVNSQLKDNTVIKTANGFMAMAWKYYKIIPIVAGCLYGYLTGEGDLGQRVGKITKYVAFGLSVLVSFKIALFMSELI